MARLFLIRHGEPEAAWGGPVDDPALSARGREQAQSAADQLARLGTLAASSSPMRRCLETAAPFVEASGARLVVQPRVSEVATPQGVTDRRHWLQLNFPWRGGAPRLWTTLSPELRAWRDGMLAYVTGLRQDSAIFTHFIAINVITGAALARPETIVCKPDYASITEIEVADGGLRLVRAGAEMTSGEVR